MHFWQMSQALRSSTVKVKFVVEEADELGLVGSIVTSPSRGLVAGGGEETRWLFEFSARPANSPGG